MAAKKSTEKTVVIIEDDDYKQPEEKNVETTTQYNNTYNNNYEDYSNYNATNYNTVNYANYDSNYEEKIDDDDEEEEQKLPSDAIPGYNPAEIDLSVYNTPAEDIDAWWYIDKENNTQGPFVWQQMQDWWMAGFLTEDILVMKIGEDDFSPINLRKEFLVKPKPKSNPLTAGFHPPTKNEIRQLNIALTKFNAISNDNYWANRGLPSDPAGRQMAHYFDLDAFQEQKRREKELGIKPKAAKNWRDLRDIKKKKKIRNYVKNMLKD